jgi:succinate dehydrogenase hydrophobic anchor subunit
MKVLPLLVLAALFSASARADTFDDANRAYEQGHAEEAAGLFGRLIAERGYSAPLCFDLGNAELKAGHLGAALLNYERARYLAPGDAGINHNLQLARQQAGLKPNPYRWWQVVIRSIDWTVWLALICGSLGFILFALIGMAAIRTQASEKADWRKFFKAVLFICIPLFLFFGFVELSAVGFGDRIEGVIVAKEATLRLSPFDSAERTGAVPEGELVTVEKRYHDYLWIDERSRQSGWVAAKELEPVVPGSFEAAKD